MMLRADVGEVDRETAEFWTGVQSQGADQRLQSFEADGSGSGSGKRRRRKPRRRRPPQAT